MREYEYYVYIMASTSGTLYIGVSGNIEGRIWQHKQEKIEGFTKKYHCNKLVYYEEYQDIYEAIAREKQLKKWNRKKKEKLIKTQNYHWEDLSKDWFDDDWRG